jgi:hypothetical protein
MSELGSRNRTIRRSRTAQRGRLYDAPLDPGDCGATGGGPLGQEVLPSQGLVQLYRSFDYGIAHFIWMIAFQNKAYCV